MFYFCSLGTNVTYSWYKTSTDVVAPPLPPDTLKATDVTTVEEDHSSEERYKMWVIAKVLSTMLSYSN